MEFRKPVHTALRALVFVGLAVPVYVTAADYAATGTEQPKITQRQATELALNRVPQGTVKTARLQQENGRPVWFLDIVGYNSRSREEVLVDASNGRVLSSKARSLDGPSSPEPSATTG
jgi:uncharacterized membrane protein YkoI